MTKLTDLEICKRLAEIDGAFKSSSDGVHVAAYFNVGTGIHTYESVIHGYNPLTDDALCFKLMVKYQVTFQKCPFYIGRFLTCIRDNDNGLVAPKRNDTNPNKAICMTIIEAHK